MFECNESCNNINSCTEIETSYSQIFNEFFKVVIMMKNVFLFGVIVAKVWVDVTMLLMKKK